MVMKDITAEDVLKWAIEREDAAHKLYRGALDKINDPGARAMISQLAEEELSHKESLEKLSIERLKELRPQKIEDLKIAEYLKNRELMETSTLQDVLVFAMKREKEAHDFYTRFALAIKEPEVKKVLEALAQQELRHKRDIEAFYDEVIYQED